MGSQKSLHDERHKALVARLVQAREEAGLSQGERRVDAIEFLDFCRALKKPARWFVKGWPE